MKKAHHKKVEHHLEKAKMHHEKAQHHLKMLNKEEKSEGKAMSKAKKGRPKKVAY